MPTRTSKARLILGFLAAAILVFSLSACAGGQASQKASSSGDREQVSEQASDSGSSGEPSGQELVEPSDQASGQASGQVSDQDSDEPSDQMPADPSQQMPTEPPADTKGGVPWLDSNIEGNVTADTTASPQDDFYLSVNHDWLASTKIPAGAKTTGSDLALEGRKRAQEAVAGAELSGHDAKQAQLLYRAAADMDARNAAGCEPARATVEDIRSLETLDDMSAFLLDVERSAGVPTLIRILNKADYDTFRYATIVGLSPATFGSSMGTIGMDATMVEPESDLYQARLASASAVLTKLGYTADEAKAAFANRVEVEKRIVEAANDEAGKAGSADSEAASSGSPADVDGAESAKLTLAELDGIAGAFPLGKLAESRGYASAEGFVLDDEAAVRAAAALYTQDNIELLRDYFICGYALEVASWLDAQTYEAWVADYAALGYYDYITITDRSDVETTAFNLTVAVLPTPVGRAFVEGCNLEHQRKVVEGLCADAIETHKKLVNGSEWLSQASKERLTKKLDALTVQAVCPDVWEDYSGLNLDGLDYFGARRAIWLADGARNAAHTNGEVDKGLWSDPSLVSSTARYDGITNAFYVAAGTTEPAVSRYEAGEITLSELLGGSVGYAVFHEIAHSLDPAGIYRDGKGQAVESSLLEPADLEEYQKRTQKLTDYYDSITAWKGQQLIGQLVTNEGLAEICGMRARLAYAADKEGFDYKAFFEARAKMALALRTPLFELQCLYGADLHPLTYVDVNAAVQQFDEFNDAYGVKDGDAMYLAPEKRFVLW